MTTQTVAPTSEILYSIQWMGREVSDDVKQPFGSGVVLHRGDEQYLVTALHVATGCEFRPLIRRRKEWLRIPWQTVATDEDVDIAILKTTQEITNLIPRYGADGVYMGGIGRAMGFPVLVNPYATDHVTEMEGFPIAFSTMISAYFGDRNQTGVHYLSGYINSGFSGGAVVLPTNEGWTIAGIITHREGVLKKQSRVNSETGEIEKYWYDEPSGLIRYVGIETVIDMIDKNRS